MAKDIFSVNITEVAAFGKILGVALPHVQPFWNAIMSFDINGILAAIVGLGSLLDKETFGEFIGIGVKVGIFKKIANSIPFKKEYNVFGMSFRVI